MAALSNSDSQNFKFQRLVAIVGLLLFLGKLFAWYLTESDAVFSDAMESIVNVIAAFLGLYSLYLAAKPRDHNHPYGHGKVEFITAGIEGALIIFAGVLIIMESVSSLIRGNIVHKIDVGILIVAITAIVNYLVGYISIKKGKEKNSLVLQASGKHLQSDTITTLGVVFSLLLVHLTKLYWIDSAVAGLFGGYIMFVGYKIVRKSLSGIMDEADQTLISNLAIFLEKNRKKEWIDVHNFKIQQYGSRLHIDGHITLPYYFDVRSAHKEMEEMIKLIAKNMDRKVEFNIHMDDCKPFSCEICTMNPCDKRLKPFRKKIEWSFENISQIDKHTAEQN